MSKVRTAGIWLLAALIALFLGLGLPTGSYGPTLAVAVFVCLCFALKRASLTATVTFALLVALLPSIFFGVGYTYHHPLFESAATSIQHIFLVPRLAIIFLGGPLLVGLIVQGCLVGFSKRILANG